METVNRVKRHQSKGIGLNFPLARMAFLEELELKQLPDL